jgi:hypothetical protein
LPDEIPIVAVVHAVLRDQGIEGSRDREKSNRGWTLMNAELEAGGAEAEFV